jgi:hypothetical protein
MDAEHLFNIADRGMGGILEQRGGGVNRGSCGSVKSHDLVVGTWPGKQDCEC